MKKSKKYSIKELDLIRTTILGVFDKHWKEDFEISTLWEISCDILDIDYDNKLIVDTFNEVLNEYEQTH